MLLEELRLEYVASNARIRSRETCRLLRISTDHFSRFLAREPMAADLTDRNLSRYVQWRRAAGRAETTIERETTKLLTLARYAASIGQLPTPRLRLPKAKLDAPVAFLRHEMLALWRAAERYDTMVRGVPGRLYMPALLDVIWDTGERLGAVLAIRRDALDLVTRWVTLQHRKGHGDVLVRRLRRVTARRLAKVLNSHQSPLVFGSGHRTTLYHHLDSILRQAGLPADRRHKFHCLRRSHASWLQRAGGDATAALGHSAVEITRRYYLDPRITDCQQPADVLFEPRGWWNRIAALLGR